MFDNRLILLREELGKTKKEVADALNMPYNTYSNYELNLREPNSEILIKIADYYNVSVDFLLGLTNVKSVDNDVKIACKVTGLSEKAILELQNIHEELKKQLDRFICFDGFIEILSCLWRIDIVSYDRNVFEYLDDHIFFLDGTEEKNIWDELNIPENEEEYIINKCYEFVHEHYGSAEGLYDNEIDLQHFRTTKEITKFISYYEKKHINSKKVIMQLIDFLKKEVSENEKNNYIEKNNSLLKFINALENNFLKDHTGTI